MQIIAQYQDGSSYKIASLSSKSGMPTLSTQPTKHQKVGVTAIKKILLRPVKTPLKKKSGILAALPFQLETLLPLSSKKTLTIPLIFPSSLITLTAKISDIRAHIASDDTPYLTTIPSALFRYAQFLAPDKDDYAILYIGAAETFGVRLENGFVSKYCKIDHGIDDFDWDAYIEEVAQMSAYLGATEMHFTGEIDKIEGLEEALTDALHITPFSPKVNVKTHALPIGMALDVLARDSSSVNFRASHFRHKKLKQQSMRMLSLLTALSLSVSALLFLIGDKWIGQEKTKLSQEIEQFRTQYVDQFPKIRGVPLEEMSRFIKNKKSKVEEVTPPIAKILHTFPSKLTYSLITFDLLQSPTRYSVKLEFSAPSSDLAESFHETLLSKATKLEWRQGTDGYQVSFQVGE